VAVAATAAAVVVVLVQ